MNLLDLLIVLLAASAAVGGYRLGLLARSVSWLTMAGGVILAARALPWLVGQLQGPGPTVRLVVAAAVLIGAALLGQAVGLIVGSRLHLAIPPGPVRLADRAGGAVAGVLGVLVALWLLLPAMAEVPGVAARLSRRSAVARTIDRLAPAPPDTLQTLGRLMGDDQFPQVFTSLRPAPDLGPPPAEAGLSAATASRVAASTVLVEGRACDRIHQGSGFVAGAGLVVTNAHVVAGVEEPRVVSLDGARHEAEVVLFDAALDLALLRSSTLSSEPLLIGDGAEEDIGAVFGHPGGGPLRLAPFRINDDIDAVGRDIYGGDDTQRRVYVLAADLAPGDSGGALVDAEGRVVGVAFAIAPDRPGTAYALADEEIREALAAPRGPVSTGPCLNR